MGCCQGGQYAKFDEAKENAKNEIRNEMQMAIDSVTSKYEQKIAKMEGEFEERCQQIINNETNKSVAKITEQTNQLFDQKQQWLRDEANIGEILKGKPKHHRLDKDNWEQVKTIGTSLYHYRVIFKATRSGFIFTRVELPLKSKIWITINNRKVIKQKNEDYGRAFDTLASSSWFFGSGDKVEINAWSSSFPLAEYVYFP